MNLPVVDLHWKYSQRLEAGEMKYRESAVAGRFYPASAVELRHQLAMFFTPQPALSMAPKALIVPHAGYVYSGAVAGEAYSLIRNAPRLFNRVVLLGPSHYVGLEGCAVPDSDVFITPLGEIPIDRAGVEALVGHELAVESESAHHWEHSLEVQLPFLQYCLDEFTLLPIVVGQCRPERVSRVLALAAEAPDTLIVVSSDLSHYHPYLEANEIDANTVAHIQALATDLQPQQACGCYAINGLLDHARDLQWQIRCVSHTNSGDVMARHEHRHPGDNEEVVGYASFVLY